MSNAIMKWMQSLQKMILAAVFLASATSVVAQDRIPWLTDLRQAREAAERQNRLVLLHFWTEDCIPCKQVERNVFNQPEFIRAVTTGYIPVKINANQQPQLADFYNIERVPTDVIVTPEGREVQRFQSLQDANQYIAMLDGIRAHASVGDYEPQLPSSTPVATRPQQNAANAAPYGGYTPTPPESSGYGQTGYEQASPSQPAPTGLDTTQRYTQNRYAPPLNQPTAPQHQELAPRYANPYAQEAGAANSDQTGSRWGQPSQSSGANGADQSQPTPTCCVVPSGAGDTTNRDASRDSQYERQAFAPPVAQNQEFQRQVPQGQRGGEFSPSLPDHDVSARPQPPARQPQPNAPQPPAQQPQFSLEGYCPVTLVQNRVWTPGDKKWGAEHEGHIYLFAGPQQQQQFLANPYLYAPLLAGYDPVRFAEAGQLVRGRREFGLYIDDPGPIALFADEAALERFHANSGYYFNVMSQAKSQQAGQTTR